MGNQVLGARLNEVYTSNEHGLGRIHVTPDGDTYMFLQADGAVTKDLFYVYNANTFQIQDQIDLTNFPADTKIQPLCVCSQTLADNEYIWAVVGPHKGFTATSAEAVDALDVLYGHATAGTLADTASAIIVPMVSVTADIGSATTGTFIAYDRMYAYDAP